MDDFSIAIVGSGPRGISILERLCRNVPELAADKNIIIHIIDSTSVGSGRVWRPNQSKEVIMNTVASQITLFTDESVECKGPIIKGPGLYHWAKNILPAEKEIPPSIKKEAGNLCPNSYPSRAFYGYYLNWVLRFLENSKPNNVKIYRHYNTVIALDDIANEKQVISLDNPLSYLIVDAVVLAIGHFDVILTKQETKLQSFAMSNNLQYIPPSNAADTVLEEINPKEPIILRGLGLTFFDYMALLSTGLGGKYIRINGKLVYKPSGKEPKLYAGSHRGIPYHARGENEKGPFGRYEPRFLTINKIDQIKKKAIFEDVSFKDEIWPLISKEVKSLYYETLLLHSNHLSIDFIEEYKKIWNEEDEKSLLLKFKIPEKDWWSWDKMASPYKDMSFKEQDLYRKWIIEYLYNDIKKAKEGNVSNPLKAALDALRDLRNEIRLIVDYGGISGESYKNDLDKWYNHLNPFLSIGPPVSRIEEMVALMEAGILELIGPDMQVESITNQKCFRVYSPLIPDYKIESRYLIEARLPAIDIRRSTDPLLQYLLETGQCRSFVIRNKVNNEKYETGGLEVTNPHNQVINKDGVPHSRQFAFGIPTEGVHWATAAGIRPGVNSVTLGESDALARRILSLDTLTKNPSQFMEEESTYAHQI